MHYFNTLLRILGIVLLIFSTSVPGFGQVIQRSYLIADDFQLSDADKQITPYDIEEDTNGFIYFAGPDGVHRFNGRNMQRLNQHNQLFISIFKDHQQQLWVTSLDQGLFKIARDSLIPYRFNHLLENFSGLRIEAIYFDGEGTLHVARRGAQYYSISDQGRLTQHANKVSDLHGFVIVPLSDGKLFHYSIFHRAASDSGDVLKVYYQYPDGSVKKVAETVEREMLHPSTLLQRDDSTWVLSTGLKTILSGKNDSLIYQTQFPSQIIKMHSDIDGNLWAGTFNKGVHRVNPDNFRSEEYILASHAASPLCNDSRGGMWVSSGNQQFAYLHNPAMVRYSMTKGHYTPPKYRTLCTDYQTAYLLSIRGLMAFKNNGSVLMPRPTEIPDRENWTPGNVPTAFYADSLNDRFYSSSINLLGVLEDNQWSMYPVQHEAIRGHKMTDLFSITENQLIGVTPFEVLKMVNHVVTDVYPVTKDIKLIKAFAAGPEGQMYIGSPSGVWQLENRDFLPLATDSGFFEHPVECLAWADGCLWIQTKDNGLYCFSKGRLTPVLLNGSRIQLNECVVSDEEEIWGRTLEQPSKLVRIQIEDDSVAIDTYIFDDHAFSFPFMTEQLIVLRDTVYLGAKGVLFRTPVSQLVKEGIPPKAYISKVYANYAPLSGTNDYVLPYESNSVAIEFDAISFRLRPVEFRCRLIGFDTLWTTPTYQALQFTNLNPGHYRFQVQSRTANESWGVQQEIRFHILTPYWQTWWFQTLVVLGILFLLGGVFLLLHRAQQRRAALIIETLQAEQKALRSQMNPHFVFNALNSAQKFLMLGKTDEHHQFMGQLADLMRSGLEHSQLAFIPLEHELKFLKNYLKIETQRFPDRFSYRLEVDADLENQCDVISLPPLMIQPICENAIKHAYDKSTVEIVVRLQLEGEHHLLAQIQDNGIGFLVQNDKPGNHKSLGLKILESRIQLLKKQGHNASYHLASLRDDPPRGTVVTLKLPLQ